MRSRHFGHSLCLACAFSLPRRLSALVSSVQSVRVLHTPFDFRLFVAERYTANRAMLFKFKSFESCFVLFVIGQVSSASFSLVGVFVN
jgi:hypothetical protein